MKIGIILGTRPEIIKMSPIIKECSRKKLNFFVLHTNQHYSENLDKIFFDDLQLPQVNYNLNVGSGTHGQEVGKMIIKIEEVLIKEKPNFILVQGDTNTVLAGALVASKLKIKIGHIEAGLRSYSKEMPEEINRILTDHCSDLLFVPTKIAKEILIKEGILEENIFITGNTVVDAIYQNLKLAKEKSNILESMGLKKQAFFLLTLHRPENVDQKQKIEDIFNGLNLVHKKFGLPIIFPIHPRAEKKIKEFNIKVPNGIKLINPVGYFDFLELESNAKLILTDSGGVQEEACILKTPCVTLRINTERPETLQVKSNVLAGANPQKILETTVKMLGANKNWKNPFGNGNSAEKIIKIIIKNNE